MCFLFSMPGLERVLNSLVILSLLYYHRSAVANGLSAFNLCTESHCEHCSGSQLLKCLNRAVSNRVGDLCSCCHSCVQYRDFGESCGSQLAMRSLEKLKDSNSRVTVLATTSCREGFICENFICKKIFENVNIAIYGEESYGVSENSLAAEDPSELNNQPRSRKPESQKFRFIEDFIPSTRGMKEAILTPSPIAGNRQTLSKFDSLKNEISDEKTRGDVGSRKTKWFNPSGHLINLLVFGKEFQLIYGHDASADFDLLIKLIDNNHPSSIIKDEEVEILKEKFTDVFRHSTNNANELKFGKEVHRSSHLLNFGQEVKTDNHNYFYNKKDSGSIEVQKKYVPHIYTLQHSKIRFSEGNVREKRELNETETSIDIAVGDLMSRGHRQNDGAISKQYSGISVYDIVNKTPRQIENLSQWLLARNVDTKFQSKPRLFAALNNDANGSEMNIHITGVPRPTNLSIEDLEMEEKHKKVIEIDQMSAENSKYDDFEMFVTETSTDVPTTMNMEIGDLKNNTKSVISENLKKYETDDIVNVTHHSPLNISEKIQYFDTTNYKFTFPESPIPTENEYYRDADITVNETEDEFKAQLDRIETRTIFIENAIFDIFKKINDERYEKMDNTDSNNPILRNGEQEDDHDFLGNEAIRKPAKSVSLMNENSSDFSFFLNNPASEDFSNENTPVNAPNPHRSNRRWPYPSKAANNSRIRRLRTDRSEGKIIESGVNSRRNTELKNGARSYRRRQSSLLRRPSTLQLTQNSAKPLEDKKHPIYLSSDNSNGVNRYNNQHPRLFSNDQSSIEVSSSSPAKQSIRPLKRLVDRAVSIDQSSRKIEQKIRVKEKNFRPVDFIVEEPIILLETQIPRSVKLTDSTVFEEPMKQSSVRFLKKYDDDLDVNQADGTSTFNLFLADGKHLELEAASREPRIQETLVLPMVSDDMKKNQQGDQEVDDVSYPLFPAYQDYVESSRTKKEKDQTVDESSQSSGNLKRNLTTVRRKRDVENVTFKVNSSNDTKISYLIPGVSGKPPMSSSLNGHHSDSKKPIDTHKTISDTEESSLKKRSRRGLRMVDWLQAAQEYQERLRQVRIAAIKTWLASREVASYENLTNIKLFSHEVPLYLEQYKPTSFQDNFDDFYGESSQDYPMELSDSADWLDDRSEVLTDIYVDDNMPRENDSEPEMSANDEVQFIEVSSLSGPKKFTITTNGNSTIRIEKALNPDNVTDFEDHFADGSSNRETSHDSSVISSDTDYFDHMYESFDTDDEDFNYDESYSAMSEWLNELDVIEKTNVKGLEEHEKSKEEFDQEEQEDSSARFKRDSPFLLFKVKGNSKKDIVIWPSRWMDLMHRHLRLNRTGNTPPRMTKRRFYLRPRKIDSKLISSNFESIP